MISLGIYETAYAKAQFFDHSGGASVHIHFGIEKIGNLGYLDITAEEARTLADELRKAAEKADALNRLRKQAAEITEAA